MRIYLAGADISPHVALRRAVLLDGAGGRLDSLELELGDTRGLWSQWQPALGDTLRLIADGLDSGECYIDQMGQRRGVYVLRALSAPVAVKESRSRSWERVTLLQLASDVAGRYGFGVRLYGAPNPTYDWVDQSDESDLGFLARRCRLESCTLKVSDNHLIIYSEPLLEEAAPARVIGPGDFAGEPEYRRESAYGACVVSWGGHMGEFKAGESGPTLYRSDIPLTSGGEAGRFAKGLLREANRESHLLTGSLPLDLRLAGGGMAEVAGMGSGDGVYMIEEAEHRLTDKITALRLRRRLEGY